MVLRTELLLSTNSTVYWEASCFDNFSILPRDKMYFLHSGYRVHAICLNTLRTKTYLCVSGYSRETETLLLCWTSDDQCETEVSQNAKGNTFHQSFVNQWDSLSLIPGKFAFAIKQSVLPHSFRLLRDNIKNSLVDWMGTILERADLTETECIALYGLLMFPPCEYYGSYRELIFMSAMITVNML